MIILIKEALNVAELMIYMQAKAELMIYMQAKAYLSILWKRNIQILVPQLDQAFYFGLTCDY